MTSDLGVEGRTLIWGLTINSAAFPPKLLFPRISIPPRMHSGLADATQPHIIIPSESPLVQHNSTKSTGAQSNLRRCICWGRD